MREKQDLETHRTLNYGKKDRGRVVSRPWNEITCETLYPGGKPISKEKIKDLKKPTTVFFQSMRESSMIRFLTVPKLTRTTMWMDSLFATSNTLSIPKIMRKIKCNVMRIINEPTAAYCLDKKAIDLFRSRTNKTFRK